MQKKTRNILIGILMMIGLTVGAGIGYVSDSYEPTESATVALQSTPGVTVENQDDYRAFRPVGEIATPGLIFYQGGKVEAEAYAPLMHKLAEQGIAAFLVEMPFNLAIFDTNAAADVLENETEISDWYLAGHSLGGAMAANYVADHVDTFSGLILLAAYSTKDLSAAQLPVLSIYGSKDDVLDLENYQESRNLVPQMEEVVIEGGNHAQFGDYGVQAGDGVAEITPSEQLEQTVPAIINFIKP